MSEKAKRCRECGRPEDDHYKHVPDEQPTQECANCAREHGTVDECVLAVLLGVVEQRHGRFTETGLRETMERVDVDYLWSTWLGPAVDYLDALLDEPEEDGQ